MLGWTSVITERSNNLDFQRPFFGNQDVRSLFVAHLAELIGIVLTHVLQRATNSFRLAIWSNAWLKRSERDTATVDSVQAFSESIHDRLERAIHFWTKPENLSAVTRYRCSLARNVLSSVR